MLFLIPCVGGDFPADEIIIYKELETEVTALVGNSVEVSFVSATLASGFVYEYRLDGNLAGVNAQRPYGEVEAAMLPAGGGFTSTILLSVFRSNFDPVLRTTNLTVYGG